MEFGSCLFAILLVCLISFQQSVAFKLHNVKPNVNEINVPIDGQYFIQNVATGLVIGSVNGDRWSTMESLEEAETNPERKAMLLWDLTTDRYTYFHTVGPHTRSDLEMTRVCLMECVEIDTPWAMLPQGPDTWEIRYVNLWSTGPSSTCITAYGLHEHLDATTFECDVNNPHQSWRLIRND